MNPCSGNVQRCSKDRPAPDVPYCMNCPKGLSLTYDHCKRRPELVDVGRLLEYARNQSVRSVAASRLGLRSAHAWRPRPSPGHAITAVIAPR